MKKMIVAAILVLGSMVFGLTPVETYGKLQVIGKNLCDKNGKPVQLRGMSTHGIQYYPTMCNENTVRALAQGWGASIIRVASYVNEGYGVNGTYLNKPEYWRTVIDQMVDWAGKYGIYVLIDWHMLTPGDPNINIKEAMEFWTYMAEKHGSKEHVLFDICNEPNDIKGYKLIDKEYVAEYLPYKVDWDVIKKYADQILPIIRAKSENVAIVGTPKWASDPSAVIGNTLKYPNTMYTMHFYAAEYGQGYRDNVQRALDAGIPVFVTEFGTQEASGDGPNDFYESRIWMDFMNANKISWCNWNFSYDKRTGAVFGDNFSISTLEDYSDTTKMKEAGKWIYKYIRKNALSITPTTSKTVHLTATISNKTLTLSTPVPSGSAIAFYDLTGKKILANEIVGTTMALPNLATGIYIIEIQAGKSSLVQKIRVE